MELKFLGTGAADFWPSLQDVDRFRVDPDIRRSTMTLVDGALLLDCGPHLLDALEIHRVGVKAIRHVLVTHPHSDHFNVENLQLLAKQQELHVWHSVQWQLPPIENVVDHPMEVGSTYQVGPFTVTALGANHCPGSLHYSIEKDGKKLFYGCDGAWLLHDTYYYMKDQQYDCMILDATVGDYDGDFRMGEHNSIPMIRSMCASFRTWKVVHDQTKIVLDHLARTLHVSHEDTCRRVEKDGYIVAFDGMVLEV